ncbi:tetratricopeptide repeat protein [Streptomyces sp. NPDC055721]|uniref:tetratricopeptide repeat protein n=1 Tax=Streptomyces sp. NPDC127132 TaxID=3345374 RepID=UPI00362C9EB6
MAALSGGLATSCATSCSAPVVVISGMGGVGKTALAVHAAGQLHDSYPDGMLYVDLHGFGSAPPRDPKDLLARFLNDLGVHHSPPADIDDRAALYRAALAERRILVVLDNASEPSQVRSLIPGVGKSAAIITSRRTLSGIPDSLRISLTPLGDEGRDLLAAVCGADRLTADPEATDRILAACGGLPLALRIAAARIASRPSWPLSTLAQRLARPHARLQALTVDDLAVRDAFVMSYQALTGSTDPDDAEAARAFRLLGLWPDHPLSTAAAAALLDRSVDEALEVLDTLIDAHLVSTPTADVYTLHDLLGCYATELAHVHESVHQREGALRRLTDWYEAAVIHAGHMAWPHTAEFSPAHTATALPGVHDGATALAWLRHEITAIREIVRQAAGSCDPSPAWRITNSLVGYGNSYWWDGHWAMMAADALAAAQAAGAIEAEALVHNTLAGIYGHARQYEKCLEHLTAAGHLLTEAGETVKLSRVLANQAVLFMETERIDEAFEAIHRAIDLDRQAGLPTNPADLHRLAGTYLAAGDPDKAEQLYRSTLSIFREGKLVSQTIATLINLGDTLRVLGRREECLAMLTEARAESEAVGAIATTVDALETTARAYHHFGDAAEARRLWIQALEMARAHGIDHIAAACLKGLQDASVCDEPWAPQGEQLL